MFHLKKVFLSVKTVKIILFCVFFLTLNIYSAVLVKGDSQVAGQSFTFCTGNYEIDSIGDYFYITAKNNGAGEYTISRFRAFEDQFKPICPGLVTILGNNAQANPIYSKGIKYFSLINIVKDKGINTYPVVVTNDNPTSIYVLDLSKFFGNMYEDKAVDLDDQNIKEKKGATEDKVDSKSYCGPACTTSQSTTESQTPGCTEKISKISVIPYENIKNADGDPITTINGIATSSTGLIFSAVDIGISGGGISLLFLAPATGVNAGENPNKLAQELDALEKGQVNLDSLDKSKSADNRTKSQNLNTPKNNKNSKNNNSDNLKKNGQSNTEEQKKFMALFSSLVPALDVSSSVVKITSDLDSIEFGDMYWDSFLKCLFVALKVKAGAGATDGCKALVLGKLDDQGAFTLSNFAPDAVFSGQNQIVGATGAGAQVSLHKVRVMHSSNRLNYVIVLGSNGAPAATKKSVYALPLVRVLESKKDVKFSADSCSLANKNSNPTDLFTDSTIKMMLFRNLSGAAQASAETYTFNDDPAKVGFGPLDYDISEIFVVGDAVYALVKAPENNGNGGLFMSRALFDEYGKIKRWTEWQAVSSSTAPFFGASLNSTFGDFVIMSGQDANNVDTVKRTIWSEGDADGIRDLSVIIGKEFPKNIAGVQGLFEYPYNALGQPYGMNDITMLVATGYKKVVLSELAYLSAGNLIRNTGDFATGMQSFGAGQITVNFPIVGTTTRVISISGGALDKIGPVNSSAIAYNQDTNGRLFVGGIGGLAVLVDNNGNGWTSGLGPNFAGLTNTMAFRKVGNFSFIRKLFVDGNYLYILTDTNLYRSDITSPSNNFVTGVLDYIELANLSNVPGSDIRSGFLDFTASFDLGLLATSYGLFRVGDGKSISTSNASNINWTRITIPSALGPIKQLFPVSATLRDQDLFGSDTNGVLYLLSSYYGNDSAQFNRFTVNNSAQINSANVLPLPDYYTENKSTGSGAHSYFTSFGKYKNVLDDEGGIRYTCQDRDLSRAPILNILMPNISCGQILPETQSKTLMADIASDSDIVNLLRSSTGPAIMAGDFGLRVNE